ncbi:response regulator [Terriglobus albidus]|uniref:response regulator n=1 Tax=Terriglobus albidus TaxID=1592106 RepID=UPI0021DF9C0A|nr:response regulator transcription factor [Terriglobus albidus]
MNSPIRIVLIDDHTLFRESLVRLLSAETGIEVVAHGGTLAEALELLSNNSIDVLLLDYDLGNEFGTELLQELQRRQISTRVLMVTAGMRDSVMFRALNEGLAGVVYKHSGTRQLVEAIQKVAGGEMWLETEIVRSLIANSVQSAEVQASGRNLTDRQRDVLRCVLDGLANKEIAAKMEVSETNVKAVIQELFHKAGVRTRSQLVRIAIEKYSDWLRNDP